MPKIITICSSMQFFKEMQETSTRLEHAGWTVYIPDLSEESNNYLQLNKPQQVLAKRAFIESHFQKIHQADAVLVLNYEKKGIQGYIGSNTLMEIGVAFHLGKKIFLLNTMGEQGCKEEVMALTTVILNGKLAKINI